MTEPRKPRTKEGLSSGMKIIIAVMLLIVLLPSVMMSLPLAKIVVAVYNDDDIASVSGSVYIHGDYMDNFAIGPGNHAEFSYFVSSGDHELRIYYHFEEPNSYSTSTTRTYSVWPLGTEEITVFLRPNHYYYANSLT